jgi:uncharacterized membrane protein YkvA (DUF1232 family)
MEIGKLLKSIILEDNMDKTYIDELRDKFRELSESGQEFDRELLHFPDIVKLLCDLLDVESVDREARVLINVALGYLLVPNDVVPEDIYGAYGYMDDMYVSCVVLSVLKQRYTDLISRLWSGDDPFAKVLDLCTFKSERFLEEKNLKEKLLRYCGLSD